MRKFLCLSLLPAFLFFSPLSSDEVKNPKIGVVDFKICVEESKLGKQEQASFEAMKGQMEKVVEEKEKVLTELAGKLNNPDELDLMSPEAETDMKRKFRALSQEMQQIQSQFYQTLNQANFKIVQKISESVGKASEKAAKEKNIDVVLNSEGSFFASKALDISRDVVKYMDLQFEEDAKNAPAQATK